MVTDCKVKHPFMKRLTLTINKHLYVILCSDLFKFLCDLGQFFGVCLHTAGERRIATHDTDKFSIRSVTGGTSFLERCRKEDYTLDVTLPIPQKNILVLRFDLRIFRKGKNQGL